MKRPGPASRALSDPCGYARHKRWAARSRASRTRFPFRARESALFRAGVPRTSSALIAVVAEAARLPWPFAAQARTSPETGSDWAIRLARPGKAKAVVEAKADRMAEAAL